MHRELAMALASGQAGREAWDRGGIPNDVSSCSFSNHLLLLVEPLRNAGLLEAISSSVPSLKRWGN